MHKRLIILASFLVLMGAGSISTAWAGWGCAARGSGTLWGNSWKAPTEQRAINLAMVNCHGDCYIVGCSPDVNTLKQAAALWPAPTTSITHGCGFGRHNKCP